MYVLQDYKALTSEMEKQIYIKQNYFYISASLKDIFRRFKKRAAKLENFDY